jgi:glyoxylase-like metal-dependent hydrolase (beta-lactamase superfamily II)
MLNLRRLFVIVMGVFSSVFVFNSAFAALAEHTTRVADGIYAYGNPAEGYTSMFVVTEDGVIVLEPVNTRHSKALLKSIRSVTDQAIRYLLHSHNHWDHSGGGQIFRDEGASIVAHVEAYEWMKANPHPDMALPNESWAGYRKDIELGGITLELHYLGMNHGLGMTVFRLPKEKIVFIADLITPNRLLFTIVPDFNIKEWLRTLKEIEALDFETAIFTHGSPAIGSKKEVVENREFIEDLRSAIHNEFKKGTNPFMIPNIVKLPKYKDWAMYDEWLPMNTWRLLLDEHMGPFPWRPDHAYEGQ